MKIALSVLITCTSIFVSTASSTAATFVCGACCTTTDGTVTTVDNYVNDSAWVNDGDPYWTTCPQGMTGTRKVQGRKLGVTHNKKKFWTRTCSNSAEGTCATPGAHPTSEALAPYHSYDYFTTFTLLDECYVPPASGGGARG
jgi:hypothetical protein